MRLHGYTPAAILLDFNPSSTRMIEAGIEDWVKRDVPTGKEIQEISEMDLHAFVDLRYERGIEAGTQLARKQDSLHASYDGWIP